MAVVNSDSRLVRVLCRLYGVLLLAYPAEFRQQYGGEMRLAFRDQARAVVERGAIWALIPFALHIVGDWAATVVNEGQFIQKALMAGVTGACAVSLLASGFLALSYITLKGVSDLHPLGGLLLFACGPTATLFVLQCKAGRAWTTSVLLVGAIVIAWFSASLLERTLTSSHFEGYIAVMGLIGGLQGGLMVMAGVWRVHRGRVLS